MKIVASTVIADVHAPVPVVMLHVCCCFYQCPVLQGHIPSMVYGMGCNLPCSIARVSACEYHDFMPLHVKHSMSVSINVSLSGKYSHQIAWHCRHMESVLPQILLAFSVAVTAIACQYGTVVRQYTSLHASSHHTLCTPSMRLVTLQVVKMMLHSCSAMSMLLHATTWAWFQSVVRHWRSKTSMWEDLPRLAYTLRSACCPLKCC